MSNVLSKLKMLDGYQEATLVNARVAASTMGFFTFEKAILRSIASGLGVSYVSLANNLEGVSYSSIRQGTIEDRDHFKMMQKFMVDHFIDEIYRSWLEMAITVGRVQLPMQKYDLFADNVIYRPRGFAWVDPQREIAANVLALNNGIVSLQDIHSQYGRDTEEVFEQVDRERELADRYNIDTAFQPFGTKLPAQPTIDVGQDDGDV
jgi:lambda family phage portal protein